MLDDLFKKTKATPSIYWLPLTDEDLKKREEAREERKRAREERRRARLVCKALNVDSDSFFTEIFC